MIKLFLENQEFVLNDVKEVLNKILKSSFTFSTFKSGRGSKLKFNLQIFYNFELLHHYSLHKINAAEKVQKDKTYDLLITEFILKFKDDYFMFRDFYFEDLDTGEIVENDSNEKYFNLYKTLIDNGFVLCLNNSAFLLIKNCKYELTTFKNHTFIGTFLGVYNNNLHFTYNGFRVKNRLLTVSLENFKKLYKSVFCIDCDNRLDLQMLSVFDLGLNPNYIFDEERVKEFQNLEMNEFLISLRDLMKDDERLIDKTEILNKYID